MPRQENTEIRRIGRQLRLLREKSGRTLVQLAEAAGLSERAVRELETGRTNPSLSTVVSIADALGVTLDEIVSAARRNVPAADHTPAPASGAAPVALTRELPNPRMRARLVDFDGTSQADLPSTATFGHVLGGTIHVTLDGEESALRPGDSFHAQAGVLRGWHGAAGRLLVVEAAIAQEFAQQEQE